VVASYGTKLSVQEEPPVVERAHLVKLKPLGWEKSLMAPTRLLPLVSDGSAAISFFGFGLSSRGCQCQADPVRFSSELHETKKMQPFRSTK